MATLTLMIGLSGLIVIWAFGAKANLGVIIGGLSLLVIPQLMILMIVVGLRTGLIPQRGRRVSRTDKPIEFWITASVYCMLLLMYGGFIVKVAFDAYAG